jgi:hypothetical protein
MIGRFATLAVNRRPCRRGAALAVALATLLVVVLIAGTVVRSLTVSQRASRKLQDQLQAEWLAEGALARGAAQLRTNPAYAGETWQAAVDSSAADASNPEETHGIATIAVEPIMADRGGAKAASVRLIVQAQYPNHRWRRVAVSRERIIELESQPSERDSAEESKP